MGDQEFFYQVKDFGNYLFNFVFVVIKKIIELVVEIV